MMWRAFVPAIQKEDLDTFPAWFVSFDGERFVEVRNKPEAANVHLLRSLWLVSCDPPTRVRRNRGSFIPRYIARESISPLAKIEEVA